MSLTDDQSAAFDAFTRKTKEAADASTLARDAAYAFEAAMAGGQPGRPSPPPPSPPPATAITGEHRLISPEYRRIFGQQVSMDALGFPTYVFRYGGKDSMMSFRMTAEVGGGTIVEVSHQLKGNSSPGGSNYAKGTAGVIRMRVFPDDGTAAHLPDMAAAPIAEYTWAPAFTDGVSSVPGNINGYGTVTRPCVNQTRDVVAGEVLHFVFDNLDADPAANYYSINHYRTLAENGSPNYNLSPIDRSVLVGTRAAGTDDPVGWVDNGVTPGNFNCLFGAQMQVKLSNGAYFGVPGGFEPSNHIALTLRSSLPIREEFKPREKIVVSGAQVHTAAKVAGTVNVELWVDGVLVAMKPVFQATSDFRTRMMQGDTFGIYSWRHVVFDAPIVTDVGQTAHVVLAPQGSSQWGCKATRSGQEPFFKADKVAWTQSRAQHRRNGVWLYTLPRDLRETNTSEWWNWAVRLVL